MSNRDEGYILNSMHKLILQQEKLYVSTGEKYKVALFTTNFWFKTKG